jgi:DNA-binding SARP family transcriptional activator
MDFGVLGPLRAWAGGRPLPVRPGKTRVLLAALLLRANRVVPTEMLVDTMWDGHPPPTCVAALHNYVMRLRRCLGGNGPAPIRTVDRGYLVEVPDNGLDLWRFTAIRDRGKRSAERGRWADAAKEFGAALALWRGTPLSDVAAPALHTVDVPHLVELRAQTTGWWIGAELRLGRHEQVLPELRALVAEDPLRERYHAQLMLALHRCGRRAEALAAFQVAQRVLAEELATEPGPELRRLRAHILGRVADLPGPRPQPHPMRRAAPLDRVS